MNKFINFICPKFVSKQYTAIYQDGCYTSCYNGNHTDVIVVYYFEWLGLTALKDNAIITENKDFVRCS